MPHMKDVCAVTLHCRDKMPDKGLLIGRNACLGSQILAQACLSPCPQGLGEAETSQLRECGGESCLHHGCQEAES